MEVKGTQGSTAPPRGAWWGGGSCHCARGAHRGSGGEGQSALVEGGRQPVWHTGPGPLGPVFNLILN